MQRGRLPFNISLTFTQLKAAAGKCRHRSNRWLVLRLRNTWMGKHSLGLCKDPTRWRIRPRLVYPFQLHDFYDADDVQISWIRTIVKEMRLDDKVLQANAMFLSESQAQKSGLIFLASLSKCIHFVLKARWRGKRLKPKNGLIILPEIPNRLFKSRNAMDFDWFAFFNTNCS